MIHTPQFSSWFQGGFECSTMRFADGRRIDVSAHSHHDRRCAEDYRLLAEAGVRTVRDGLRWRRIEPHCGARYDWSSWRPMLKAARRTGAQVIWDLCHFGGPEDLDWWSAEFPARLAAYAEAAARVHREESDAVPFWCPINEISYWAFAGGEHGHIAPFGVGRGDEFKRQLVRASIAAIEAVRSVDRRARIVQADPVIHVAARDGEDPAAAERVRLTMFEAWDLLCGRREPELGGRPEHLDIVGVNFYPSNEWHLDCTRIGVGENQYRAFSEILGEVWARYGRPILITETGAEGENGPGWLRYVAGEAMTARETGVAVEGLCLYPVMDYPGWIDDRHCPSGLIRVDADWGARRLEPALAAELARQAAEFDQRFAPRSERPRRALKAA